MSKPVVERMEAIRRTLVAQAAAGAPMSSASKGDEREAFIRGFLDLVFPRHFRWGTGSITDAAGRLSGQVDLVVEIPFFPSIAVPPADVRLYVAEGVAVAMEVKSNLSNQWDQVRDTVRGVRALKRTLSSGSMWFGDNPPDTIPTIAVGYLGYKTPEALIDRLGNTDSSERPDAVLVLDDPGLFVLGDQVAVSGDALIMFVGHVINCCTKLMSSSFDFRPYMSVARPPTEAGS